jgi:hypothetical protein
MSRGDRLRKWEARKDFFFVNKKEAKKTLLLGGGAPTLPNPVGSEHGRVQ